MTVGDLVVDRGRREVTRHGEVLELKGLTYALFDALIDAGGEAVSLQGLADAVWRGEPVSNEVITQRVRLLRRALSDDPSAPRYIETRRNSGYRICARMIELSDGAPAEKAPGRGVLHWVAIALLGGVFVVGLVARGRVEPAVDPLVERARTYAATGQEDDNRRAIDLFEQKLAESPTHYGASLGLSFAYAQRVCRHDDEPSYATKARDLAQSLLARRADDAEALSALAYAYDCLGNIDRALAGYLDAWRLDERQLDARASAAHLLQVKGELASALSHSLAVESRTQDRPYRYVDIQIARCLELIGFRRAAGARYSRTVRLHPDNLFAAAAYVRFLMSDGRSDDARAAAQRANELGASTAALKSLQAELALLADDAGAALAYAEEATALTRIDSWPRTLVDVISGDADPVALSQRVDAVRDDIGAGNIWPAKQLESALLLWALERHGEALGALDAAVSQGYRDVAYLEASPLFTKMITTPVGADILRRARTAADDERDKALAADWWRASLIDPDAL